MAYSPKGIMEILEVVVRWHAGQSISAISQSLGYDRKTVRRYVRAAQGCGVSREGVLPAGDQLAELILPLLPVVQRETPARGQFEPHGGEILELITRADDPLKPKTAYEVIVDRIVYNALQRLGLGAELSSGQLVVVTGFDDSGYRSKSLEMLLSETLALGLPNGKEALVISFYDPYESHDGQSLVSAPVPEISVAPCADREAFRRLMREMNQPEERGRKRYSIVLHRPEDLLRLSRAIMVKQVLEINGGRGPEASLLKFIPGRVIEVPDSTSNRDHLIDAAAARYFYHSSGHFYSEALEDIEAALGQLDEEFQKPGLRHLFDSTAAPGQGDR